MIMVALHARRPDAQECSAGTFDGVHGLISTRLMVTSICALSNRSAYNFCTSPAHTMQSSRNTPALVSASSTALSTLSRSGLDVCGSRRLGHFLDSIRWGRSNTATTSTRRGPSQPLAPMASRMARMAREVQDTVRSGVCMWIRPRRSEARGRPLPMGWPGMMIFVICSMP